ncbi:SH3 domain-containing protein, partial [Dichotomocladium elegans]
MYNSYCPSPAPEKPMPVAAQQTSDGGEEVMLNEEEPPPPYTPPPASAPPHPVDEKPNHFGHPRTETEKRRPPNPSLSTTAHMENHKPSPVVIAKYSYSSQEPGDLSFAEGDCIIVTKRNGNRSSWWEGEIGTRRGLFPANYTEDL